MKRPNFRHFVLTVTALAVGAVAWPAAAQNPLAGYLTGRPYVGASFSYNWLDDADLDGGGLAPGFETDLDSDAGVVGALGWHFDNGFRAELEFSYFDVDVDSISGGGVTAAASGSQEALTGMFNLVYELDLGGRFASRFGPHGAALRLDKVHPYIGAGVGISSIDVEAGTIGGGLRFNDDDSVLSYQLIGGFAVDLTDRVALTTDYRYFETEDAEINGVDVEVAAHKVTAGLRFTFPPN